MVATKGHSLYQESSRFLDKGGEEHREESKRRKGERGGYHREEGSETCTDLLLRGYNEGGQAMKKKCGRQKI